MQRITKPILTLFITFLLFSFNLPRGHAQSSILDKRISLQVNQTSIEHILQAIESQAGVTFSYFSGQIDADRRVSLSIQDRPLGDVLNELLGLQITQYQVEGNHISLGSQLNEATVQGRITTSDGQAAPYTTIRLQQGKSTMADERGYYRLATVAPGKHVLQVSLVGGDTQTRDIWVKAGTSSRQDFILSTNSRQLNEVLIVGTKYRVTSEKESESVSRTTLPYLENPQVYSVIDKELIKEQLSITLDESFRNVPGAAPSKTGAGMPAFFSRGFQTSESFRNGMATYLRTGIDLANVERVEAVKGPSSTFFGAQMTSFGGVINYVTKKPYDQLSGEVSYTVGSWNLNRLTADFNTPIGASKDLLFRFNAARQEENSFQYQGGNTSLLIAPSISYRVNDRLDLLLDIDFLSNQGVTPAGWFISGDLKATSFDQLQLPYRESLNDNSLVTRQHSSNVFAQVNYTLSENWLSETKYAWGTGGYDDLYIFDLIWRTTDSVDRILRTFTNERTARHNFQQNFKGDFHIGGIRNRAVIGIDWVANFRHTRYDGLGYGAKVFESVDLTRLAEAPVIRMEEVQQVLAGRNTGYNLTQQASYGAYVADVMTIVSRLNLSLGLRFDRFLNDGSYNTLSRATSGDYAQSTLSPRLGFTYEVWPSKFSLFGNYINGFKNIGNQIQPDQTISVFKAQQANQLEGGVKVALSNSLNATLTYYNIAVSNSVMNRVVDNMNFYFQEGEQKSEGFEAEFIGNPFAGFNIVASYGYNHNRFTKANSSVEGKRALGTPAHVVNLWASYALIDGSLKGLGIGGGYSYVSDAFLDASNGFILDGYKLLDATLYYNHPKFRISVKGNNLLDERYWVSDGYYARPQKPANFLASIAYRF